MAQIRRQSLRSCAAGLSVSLALITAGLPGIGHAAAPDVSAPALAPAVIEAVQLVPTSQEVALLDLANVSRLASGLRPLEFDSALLGIARTRAAAQLTAPASHYDALGQLVFVGLLDDAHLDFSLVGENLAILTDGPSAVFDAGAALMGSPSHRKNILEPSFTGVGVGGAVDENGRLAFAEIFRAMP